LLFLAKKDQRKGQKDSAGEGGGTGYLAYRRGTGSIPNKKKNSPRRKEYFQPLIHKPMRLAKRKGGVEGFQREGKGEWQPPRKNFFSAGEKTPIVSRCRKKYPGAGKS